MITTTESSINTCATTNQPHIKSNPKHNPNPDPTSKQHAVVSIRLNIVACPTYPENYIAPRSVVVVTAWLTRLKATVLSIRRQWRDLSKQSNFWHESHVDFTAFGSSAITAAESKDCHAEFLPSSLLSRFIRHKSPLGTITLTSDGGARLLADDFRVKPAAHDRDVAKGQFSDWLQLDTTSPEGPVRIGRISPPRFLDECRNRRLLLSRFVAVLVCFEV